MPPEIWDLTDASGVPLGRTHRRGDPIPAGLFHVVASVCAVRDDGRILVSQRAATKDHALDWEIPAGSVLAGESSVQGAVRELHEEVGLQISPTATTLVGRFTEASALFDLYVAPVDGDPAIEMDPAEIVDTRWVTLTEFDEMFAAGKMASPWIPRMREFRPRLDQVVTAHSTTQPGSSGSLSA